MLRSGVRMTNEFYVAFLAEAQDGEGDTLGALESIKHSETSTIYGPPLLRVRGELRGKQGQIELAEKDFRDAIALAQKMSAKSRELRATTSLARLLAKQDRREEARTMLAEIYNWFTEGFDTADLRDAKALLDELTA
jgi:ATP/maltotriose-dependent transcriptional regulator MalT